MSDSTIAPILGDIFGRWKRGRRRLKLENVRLLAPCEPPNIWAIGLNYRAHALEGGHEIPSTPRIFTKATTALTGPDHPIIIPSVAPNEVDYEGELVVVIGKCCRNVAEARALEYVLGYTCGNDVSARDAQRQSLVRGKSFDTFAPLGPWIETELDPHSCKISTHLNGETMQNSNTNDLIFNVRQLISYISNSITLLPGTAIMTGAPSGVGSRRKPPVFLKADDLIEVEITGIGILRNKLLKEAL
jgi:2-keto-4-pentenoate hydratase/2-oxohepta-3-ene-1,7-dioic acid hydratase in catechol pathway